MSGMPRLEGGALDLRAARDAAKMELMRALRQDEETPLAATAIVLDPALSGPLGLIAEVREFREQGVHKIHHLLDEPLETDCDRVIYFIRADVTITELLSRQVRGLLKARTANHDVPSLSVFFVPRRSLFCEKVLEEEGVYASLAVRELPLHLVPLDTDVLSLEQPCFKELFVDGDPSVLHAVASSILKLEAMFGRIPSVRGKGRCAQQVQQMVTQMRQVLASSESAQGEIGSPPQEIEPQIEMVLLIDREVDLVTPLCTELTYEGLIHQHFGISHGYVDLDPEVLGQTGSQMVKRELNSNDPLYAKIRDMHFGDLGNLLHKLARGVHEGYEERHAAHTVSQIREFMRKLNKLQHTHKSLAMHVNIAERIQRVTKSASFHKRIESEQTALSSGSCSAEAEAYLEDLIVAETPLPSVANPACSPADAPSFRPQQLSLAKANADEHASNTEVLRLLCLHSLTANGLKARMLSSMQEELLHAYGFEKVALTLTTLQTLGLLRKQEGRNHWLGLKKALQLIVEDMPEVEMGEDAPELAYTYSGYAPLSVRLVQWMVQPLWTSRREVLSVLPGPLFADEQGGLRPSVPTESASVHRGASEAALQTALPTAATEAGGAADAGAAKAEAEAAAPRRPVTLVYFIGGCTFSEISGIRWLRRCAKPQREYVIATTHICNGDSLMSDVIGTLENKLSDLEI